MKGNEARVVFFLHPVDQLKDGQVSKVQPLRRSFVVTVLLLLGLLLGLGVLVFVLLQFGDETRNQQEPVPTPTPAPFDTSNQTRGNDSSMETELSTATNGMTDSGAMPNNLCIFGPGCPIPPDDRLPPPLPFQKGMETELPTEIIQPGMTYDAILCHQSK